MGKKTQNKKKRQEELKKAELLKNYRKSLFRSIGYWRRCFRQAKKEWCDALISDLSVRIRIADLAKDKDTKKLFLFALEKLEELLDMGQLFDAIQELKEQAKKE